MPDPSAGHSRGIVPQRLNRGRRMSCGEREGVPHFLMAGPRLPAEASYDVSESQFAARGRRLEQPLLLGCGSDHDGQGEVQKIVPSSYDAATGFRMLPAREHNEKTPIQSLETGPVAQALSHARLLRSSTGIGFAVGILAFWLFVALVAAAFSRVAAAPQRGTQTHAQDQQVIEIEAGELPAKNGTRTPR